MYEEALWHHIAMHSKLVCPGDVFFAQDSRFVEEAARNGAAMIVCSHHDECIIHNKLPDMRIIAVEDVIHAFHHCVHHKYPQGITNLYAVTGTDGKSSVVNYFVQLASLSASIGTLGVSVSDDVSPQYRENSVQCTLTTPDCLTLHKIIHQLSGDVRRIAFEASSHGLTQERIAAFDIRAGVFTSFSTDHLDYHQTMENYLQSKLLLWHKYVNIHGYAIMNAAVEQQWNIMSRITQQNKIVYGEEEEVSKLPYDAASYRLLEQTRNSCKILLKFFGQEKICMLPVMCKWQIENILAAMIMAHLDGENLADICEKAAKIRPIKGRLEHVTKIAHTDVFVDYAHTVGSVQAVLSQLTYDKKVLVIACAGNRCKQKRVLMSKTASQLCDVLIITDDNPRDEDPAYIRKQLYDAACSCPNRRAQEVWNIAGRKNAIRFALEFCINSYGTKEGEVVLIVAGKGHEQYQEISGEMMHMSDHEMISDIVQELSTINTREAT